MKEELKRIIYQILFYLSLIVLFFLPYQKLRIIYILGIALLIYFSIRILRVVLIGKSRGFILLIIMTFTLTLGFLSKPSEPFPKFSYYLKDIKNLGMVKRSVYQTLYLIIRAIQKTNRFLYGEDAENIDNEEEESINDNDILILLTL